MSKSDPSTTFSYLFAVHMSCIPNETFQTVMHSLSVYASSRNDRLLGSNKANKGHDGDVQDSTTTTSMKLSRMSTTTTTITTTTPTPKPHSRSPSISPEHLAPCQMHGDQTEHKVMHRTHKRKITTVIRNTHRRAVYSGQ
jgi:hypothetical protein